MTQDQTIMTKIQKVEDTLNESMYKLDVLKKRLKTKLLTMETREELESKLEEIQEVTSRSGIIIVTQINNLRSHPRIKRNTFLHLVLPGELKIRFHGCIVEFMIHVEISLVAHGFLFAALKHFVMKS
ncbi:uncharacterized protein LOC122537372 isoform X1 [Frieseomelitta varia]|uniref:uncharacterized protein LOC122537372 isoform X1 n=1 Tax=Frieseomelitta varia TaxID=561572 RepID=UPI001CB68715|nr:uncharacterized protein LOC122537372 isoform X1 [Frieseomelitta varia]